MSRSAGADLPLRGNGCVAADFDLDGHTDLYVTTAGYNVPTDGYDALLWNDGDGTFTEGARQPGSTHPAGTRAPRSATSTGTGARTCSSRGTRTPTSPSSSASGFPTNHLAVRDLLYLNEGADANGRSTFREVGRAAGIERKQVGHGLGAVFTDYDRDGRLDLYVANDADPNQLYRNVPRRRTRVPLRGGRGAGGVDDPNAGMGIAAADFSRDGQDRPLRHELAPAAARRVPQPAAPARDRRSRTHGRELAAVLGTHSTGWGTSWADLDLDGDLDLVVANGAIPVVNLAKDAQRVQVIENVAGPGATPLRGRDGRVGLGRTPRVNGRGLAAADYDNDGDLDVAVNSIGGRLILLENDAPSAATGSRCGCARSRPAPSSRLTLPDGRRLVREVLAGQQLPLVRGSPRALRPRRARRGRRALDGPVPGRHHDAAPERRGRPGRRRRLSRPLR